MLLLRLFAYFVGTPSQQAFALEMKNAIDNQDEPLDAKLEAVMPGMHAKTQALQSTVETLASEVRGVGALVKKGFSIMGENFLTLQRDQRMHRTQLGNTFLNIAKQLLGGQPVVAPEKTAPQENPIAERDPFMEAFGDVPSDIEEDFEEDGALAEVEGEVIADSPNNLNDGDSPTDGDLNFLNDDASTTGAPIVMPTLMGLPSPLRRQLPSPLVPAPIDNVSPTKDTPMRHTTGDPSQFPRITLEAKHTCLSDLWDEWHGEGKFYDSHGGFAGREKALKGASWRKHIRQAQHSRTKRTIDAIKAFTKMHHVGKKKQSLLSRNHSSSVSGECRHSSHTAKHAIPHY